jgi:hypothetical protein
MRIAVTTAAAAALLAVVAAAPAGARVDVKPGPWCGGTLWKLMTLADTTKAAVGWTPSATTIADVARLTPPARFAPTRTTAFQKQRWALTAVIERYRTASNGELVFQLFDINTSIYMNAYVPNPKCLSSSTRGRAEIVAARNAFTKICPAPTAQWQMLGATAKLAGVGFWNPVKTTLGALANGAELRPVTSLQITTGCGIG